MKKYADIWNRYFLAIMGVSLLSSVCTQFFNATLSLQVKELKGTTAFAGLLMMVFTVAAAVFRLVGGHLSDRLGRRPIILAGLLVFLGATLACGLIPDLGWLVLFRVLQGVGFAAAGTGISVAVADVVSKDKIGEAIGYFGLGNSLTQAVGPAIALAIMAASGFAAVSLVAAGTLLLSMLIALVANYERIPQFARPLATAPAPANAETASGQAQPAEAAKPVARFWVIFEKKAVPSAVVQFTISLAFGSLMAFLTLYASQRHITQAGLFFTIAAVTTVCARLITGRLTDRWGPIYSIAPGLLMAIVSFVFLALNQRFPFLFLIAGGFFGFANGMIGPALNATAIRRSPDHRRGAASATYMVPLELALALAAVMWGAVIDASSFELVFWCSAGILVLSLALSFVFFGRKASRKQA